MEENKDAVKDDWTFINRKDTGNLPKGTKLKTISQKNLDNLLGKFGITGVDTGGMMDSIAESAQTGYGIGDVGKAATPDRDYSSSPGAMAGDMEYGEE